VAFSFPGAVRIVVVPAARPIHPEYVRLFVTLVREFQEKRS
jgi:hypothetical protein